MTEMPVVGPPPAAKTDVINKVRIGSRSVRNNNAAVVKAQNSHPDVFLQKAKQLVVDNYNAHHDSDRTPPLTTELVYIVWFTKTLENWKAILASSVLHGLLYEVSYNGRKSEAYVDVYRKINNVKIAD